MNGGTYGGKHYIDSEIVNTYTTRYGKSTRRGIGFDLKELDRSGSLLTSQLASDKTYGHTGFTGICAWNDPENRLTYIFLSNRTFPTMRNTKLFTQRIRQKIHTRAYKAIEGYNHYASDLIPG
jgi:CubicO group peptidase (beta-lactamase class C family)